MRTTAVLGVFVVVMIGRATEPPSFAQQQSMPSSAARNVLRSSADREALETAAIALIRTGDPRDLTFLGQLLRDAGFLARLDDFDSLKTLHLSRVMVVLAQHPSLEAAELCLALADDPVYLADDDRQSFLLKVLAAVKPMSDRAAALFERTNEEGYFAFNAPLLVANASPPALSLFESMMLDGNVPIARRVDCLHLALVPHRTQLPVLRTADRIVSSTKEAVLAKGVVESIFDFQLRWFGIESKIVAPRWQSASVDTLRLALHMADTALARSDLTAELQQTVGRSRQTIMQTLTSRQK